jgi:ATP-dependent protease ClpP protease subunit
MAEVRITISGPIVLDGAEVDYCYPYTTLADLQSQLEYKKPYDTIRVIINSPGGRVDEGFAMYDLLRSLEGVTVITEMIGQCSSIATAPFLAGSIREVHTHATSLVHLPTGGIFGADAAKAAAWAASLASDEARLLSLYEERAGIDPVAFASVMQAETTLTAQQLLDYGFATAIVQPATALALLPTTATNPPASQADNQAPTWAQQLMGKFSQGLTALNAAVSALRTPTTNQATTEPTLALDVTTTAGSVLTIDTGDRETYQAGDTVTDADGNAPADADYALQDGNTITIAAGAITVITPASTDSANTNSAETDDAMGQLLTVVTALAGEVRGIKQTQANQASTLRRIATTNGSTAVPARAQAANDEGKDADIDPVKAAGDARKARRDAKFKKA